MKKLSILLLAAVMLFTCFALAACGGDEETSSTSDTSAASSGDKSESSATDTSSKTETSSKPESSEPESSAPESSEPETSDPETSDPETSEPDNGQTGEAGDPVTFWVTHYDDYTQEGAGMILTEDADIGSWDGAWCDHYAFKPIDGVENGYEIVAISYGTIANGDASANGSGHTPELPEGGFIFSTSIGNNYTSDGIDSTKPDYVNDNCNEQISRSRNWKVGDKFVITGLDLEGKTVPTSTPDKNWYEAGYVSTATIAPLS